MRRCWCPSVAAANAQIKAGKLRALACFSAKRAAALPDVPTCKELGYDVEFSIWVGLFAPKGTPDAVITQVREETKKVVATEQFKTAMTNIGDVVAYHRPAGVQGVLGRRRATRRSRRAVDRQGGGLSMDRRQFVIGSAAAAAAVWSRPALAQDAFPSRPVTIINAFPPGGANDIVTRPMASALEAVFKQPVVVETKAGAAGAVGAQVAANAKPDGYTLLSHNNGISGYAEVDKLFGRQPKTTRADFIPLARLCADPVLLLVNEQQPYKTLAEFVDGRKEEPEKIVYCSGGLYGASHLPVALLEKATGITGMRHLPTAGGGPAITAALGNNAQLTTQTVQATLQHVKAGKLRALALFGAQRSKSLPDVPTMKELGYDVDLLSLGRPVRPEGHAGADRLDAHRRDRQGRREPAVQRPRRQSRSRAELSHGRGLREVLGRGRQARRRRHAPDRQGAGMSAAMKRVGDTARDPPRRPRRGRGVRRLRHPRVRAFAATCRSARCRRRAPA